MLLDFESIEVAYHSSALNTILESSNQPQLPKCAWNSAISSLQSDLCCIFGFNEAGSHGVCLFFNAWFRALAALPNSLTKCRHRMRPEFFPTYAGCDRKKLFRRPYLELVSLSAQCFNSHLKHVMTQYRRSNTDAQSHD